MKIFALGATGFVGQHLLRRLSADGHRIDVATRAPFAHREVNLIPGVRLQRLDVYDRQALTQALHGADAVINLVGILNEQGRSGAGFERAHVTLTEGLVAACNQADVHRLLQMSALNAGQGKSHYLRTKGEAERLVENSGLDYTIFQPSVIFGPGDSFFNRFHGLLKLTPVLPLACPESRFEPVYVGDVARAFARSLHDSGTVGKRFALCGPRSYSLRRLVEYTAETAGLKRRIIGLPDALARAQAAVMDFVPGKPFSTDNYLSLQVDSVCGRNGFGYFRISPRSLETIVPGYLNQAGKQARYRRFRSIARR